MIEAIGNLKRFPYTRPEPVLSLDIDVQREQARIQRAQCGDLAAFNELVMEYQDAVYRQAFWILREPEAAEDAAQEVFLTAYRKLDLFHGGPFRPWLLRITTNLCVDQLRKQKRRPTRPLELFDDYEDEIESPSWLADPLDTPEQAAERSESKKYLMKCIQQLSPEYRAAVVLIDLQEMDYREAARVLNAPIGTVKSRLCRARVQLRKVLQKSPVAQ